MKLPKEKIKPDRRDPGSMVLFSKPKVGKTTLLAGLDNCLIIDVENGTEFVEALKVNILKETQEAIINGDSSMTPMKMLKNVIDEILKENQEKGGYVYKYGVLDTVTALEEISIELANQLYRQTPMGRNWQGSNVLELPNGAGYYYSRLAMSKIISQLERCFETLILLGHTKDKLIEFGGEEITERGLALTGKTGSILCSQVDAIGYVDRNEEGHTTITFKPSKTLTAGSRPEHLKNKTFVVGTKEEDNSITVDWSEIFIDQ